MYGCLVLLTSCAETVKSSFLLLQLFSAKKTVNCLGRSSADRDILVGPIPFMLSFDNVISCRFSLMLEDINLPQQKNYRNIKLHSDEG